MTRQAFLEGSARVVCTFSEPYVTIMVPRLSFYVLWESSRQVEKEYFLDEI